ncbi:MAG: Natural resistance-associated macrophage protein [Gemmatimonadetes bacterium]|nr:Natural resistance-associated macrophage protein [Gemmatimonadota bacterium]
MKVDPPKHARNAKYVEQRSTDRREESRDESRPVGIRAFWKSLGPGIVTGAADDDPSGIATYSVAGAQYGTTLLWTALFTWPLTIAVQTMCARIGMVTGQGIAGALRHKFPRPVLFAAAVALFVANTINVGADLTGMADAAELLTGVNSHIWVIVLGVAIAAATIYLRYATLARVLKWLALTLVAYVITALYAGPTWSVVAHDTFVPHMPRVGGAWATLVAILGTTISPYLFFWQASQEVEEEKSLGRRRLADRVGAKPYEIATREIDITIGTFFSNAAMFFIILATALTLHRAGVTKLETSRQVAEALTPLAGRFASLLYTIGLLGTGALAIPTLAGAGAYAFAEIFRWRQGMDEPYNRAPGFYAAFICSIGIGIGLNFAGVNPVAALYWTAVINGVLAPFLLVGILIAASDRKLMAGQPSSLGGRIVVGATTIVMFAAAIGMFVVH